MQYQDRSKWGARPPRWNPGVVAASKGVFIHYNGPPVSNLVMSGDYQAVAGFLRGIQDYHQNRQGWPDIAYSWAVDSTGRIWELRGWGVAGAHTLGHNWDSHAIFLPLGGDQAPTPAQVQGCQTVIAEHNRRYGAGFVKGHQDAPNSTSCPGPVVLPMVRRGDFAPTSRPPAPTPSVPTPPGVDPKVNEPKLMKIGPKIWIFYAGTPWRVHVRTPADVQTFRFLGVPYQEMSESQGAFFLRYSQEVKTG